MDWNAAIEKNREALKRVLAMLVAMAGLTGNHPTLPRYLHRKVLRLLRPAEAAARRLVVVAARGLVVKLLPLRPRKPKPAPIFVRDGGGTGILMPRHLPPQSSLSRTAPRALALPLFDTVQQLPRHHRPAVLSVPRISFPGFGTRQPIPVRYPPSPRDPVDARRLTLRLQALASALDDLPRQARRLALLRARRREAVQNQKTHAPFRRISPLRPGHPPGWCRKPVHEVHDILNVTHGLAIWAMEKPDTS